jgi:hypothetical protein
VCEGSTALVLSIVTLADSAGFRSVEPGRAVPRGTAAKPPGTAPHLLLGVPREAAEEIWEIFSVGTVLHGGVDVVE